MKKNKKFAVVLLDYGILVALLILIVVFSFASKNFFKTTTLFTILKQVSITGIVCIGQTLVMLTGGIDLSVGSVAGVSAVTAAIFLKDLNMAIPLTCILVMAIALLYGVISGLCVTKLNMPPLIATLGMQTSLRGLAYIVTGGLPVYGFTKDFGNFAKGTIAGIPYMVILMIVLFVIFILALEKTTLGRYIYGVGGNEESSRLSGISVTKVKLMAYGFSGFLAGIAGLVLLSRTSSGQPSAGSGYEMDAITAVVLGGVSLSGGEGKLHMVVIGMLLMGTLTTGMIMCGINDYVQQLVKGIVLIIAVAYSEFSKKIRNKVIVAE
ncbi:MAG: ABC transporter permease [Eubacteriales bacterium]|nr:ABC transporter permease [Eubacteriales bacterium]